MADDALSDKDPVLATTDHIRAELGWGGPRQKRWDTVGKRAIIHVEPKAYEVVTLMARLCTRTIKDFNAQVYAAGLEYLMGQPIDHICHRNYELAPAVPGTPPLKRITTNEGVREVASRLTFLPPLPAEPQPWDKEDRLGDQ